MNSDNYFYLDGEESHYVDLFDLDFSCSFGQDDNEFLYNSCSESVSSLSLGIINLTPLENSSVDNAPNCDFGIASVCY